MCARGTGIGFRFHGTLSIVNVTIGSTILGSTHPISFGENAYSLPCLSNISRNQISSSGNRNPLCPIRSFIQASLVNAYTISTDFRSVGSSDTTFLFCLLFVGNGLTTGFTFLSTVFVEGDNCGRKSTNPTYDGAALGGTTQKFRCTCKK